MTEEKLNPPNPGAQRILEKLSRLLGKELEQVTKIEWSTRGYAVNPAGAVTGLGLYGFGIDDKKLQTLVDLLVSLPNLTQLALSYNKLTDISVLKELPDDWRIHAARGHSLAGLGRRQEALREAQYLQQSRAYREDRLTGPTIAAERAMILARAGEAEAALDEIERLLAGPSWTSSHTLRLDPRWDPIREHPRFKALLVKYANPEKFTY